MADLEEMTPGEVLADTSVADFIRELGLGIAAAQAALDDNSVRQMELFTTRRDDLGGRSLLDLGLTPSFYHYQHADISTSMQIRMEVGRSDEFGFGIRAGINDNQRSSESGTESSSSTTSGSRRSKKARLSMRADSTSALTIDGAPTLTPDGSTPTDRLLDLQRRLAAGGGDVDRLIFRPPTTRPDMSLRTATDKVVVNSPTVAFLRPNANSALIRIRENADTAYLVHDDSGGPLTVSTSAVAGGSVDDYANQVSQAFIDAGYRTLLLEPGSRVELATVNYETNVHALSDDQMDELRRVAGALKATGQRVEIEGFTDRVDDADYNLDLGESRARGVHEFLGAQGVPADQLRLADPPSRGEEPAAEAGEADGNENEEWRRTVVFATPLEEHWLFVTSGADFDPAVVAPSAIGNVASGPPNAYLHLYRPEALALSGNGVTIDGAGFDFAGGSVDGNAAGSAEAYAENLTRAINATDDHRAWREGNVVRVARSGDRFEIRLYATTNRQVAVQESSDFTIEEQFSETRSSVESRDQEENRAIAVGVSVDARFSRQFNMEVTGNSSISARLVSIPAPPEFLEQIRAFQASIGE